LNVNTLIRLYRALIRGERPNYVIAFVTGRCNLRCSYCCYAAQNVRPFSKTNELTSEQWASVFKGLDGLVHLTITGGEPFLREDLSDLICAMVHSSKTPRISINTNGLLTDRILSTLEDVLSRTTCLDIALAVSIDGLEAVHDRLRGLPGAYQVAYSTVKGASALAERHNNLTVRVASVLCEDNADDLGSFIEETAAWPIDFHDIGLVRDVSDTVQRKLAKTYALLTERQLKQGSLRYLGGLEWRLQRQLRREVLSRINRPKGHSRCLAGGRLMEVFPDGTIRGCEMGKMWSESVIVNGGATVMPLKDAVELPEAARFRLRAAQCSCSFECAIACSTVFQPQNWWRLLF